MGTSSPRVRVRVEKATVSREGLTALHGMGDDWVNGLWAHWLVFSPFFNLEKGKCG